MSARYLEIDSTHRNRLDYPLASSFTIPFGASTISPDWVLNGAIYFQWTPPVGILINNILCPLYDSGTVVAGQSGRIVIQSSSANIQSAVNAYKGFTIALYPTFGNGNALAPTILSYDPTTAIIVPSTPIWSNPVGAQYFIVSGWTTQRVSANAIAVPWQDNLMNPISTIDQAYYG